MNEPFEEIWNREEYMAFRDCFTQRKKRIEAMYASLMDPDHRGSIP